jgi:hypothetical protein
VSAQTQFREIDGELYLARRLEDHGYHVFLGNTTREMRKTRLREAIRETGRDIAIIGRNPRSGKAETYAQAFERLYGEKL